MVKTKTKRKPKIEKKNELGICLILFLWITTAAIVPLLLLSKLLKIVWWGYYAQAISGDTMVLVAVMIGCTGAIIMSLVMNKLFGGIANGLVRK
jgi:hypothetical protein